MAYAFILSNMAVKKVGSGCSDDGLNLAISDLCRGKYTFIFEYFY